jgi:hypothetical protein
VVVTVDYFQMILDLLFFIRGGGGCSCDKCHPNYAGMPTLYADPK